MFNKPINIPSCLSTSESSRISNLSLKLNIYSLLKITIKINLTTPTFNHNLLVLRNTTVNNSLFFRFDNEERQLDAGARRRAAIELFVFTVTCHEVLERYQVGDQLQEILLFHTDALHFLALFLL